jgi:hypothetical protein
MDLSPASFLLAFFQLKDEMGETMAFACEFYLFEPAIELPAGSRHRRSGFFWG